MFFLLAVAFASTITFLLRINAFPLKNWDEAWYAEITRNMASGNFSLLVPFWNGEYYFDKPPLYFWLTLPIFGFFGAGEWQARIVSVMAAIGATFLVYLIGKKIFSQTAGLLSVIVFLSLGQVIERFSKGNLDALLVFLFLATFYFYLLSLKKKFFLILSGIFLGLGFFVKGWLLGLFPLVLIFIYTLIVHRKIPYQTVLIFLVSVLFSAWWFILGFQKFGQRFLDWYLFNPLADNFTAHFRFLKVLLTTFLRDLGFWGLLGLFSLTYWRKTLSQNRILFSFLTTILLFFFALQFLDNFLGWYLLPTYPLVALMLGYSLERLMAKEKKLVFVLITLFLISQVVFLIKLQSLDRDRSTVTASLGKVARQIVPPGETLILDDPDFSSFLFYSQHKTLYVVTESGGKPGEWWILKKGDLPLFIKKHSPVWIVSSHPSSLSCDLTNNQVAATAFGYQFLKR